MEDNQNIEEQNILPKMDIDLLTEMEQRMEDDFKREYRDTCKLPWHNVT